MNDQEITKTIPPVEPGPPDHAPASPEHSKVAPKKHHYIAEGFKNRTEGEKKFNFRTYVGLGYFGSIGASLGLTWLLRDSSVLSPWYNGLKDNVAQVTRGNKDAASFVKHSGRINSFMTIATMFVGTTLMTIFPIKWREDKKSQIVKQLDTEIYGADRVKNDPIIREAHAEMDAAPKQTWKSILSSRVLALGATIGTGLAIGAHIDRHSIRFGRWAHRMLPGRSEETLQTIQQASAVSPNEILRGVPRADTMTSRIGSYISLDAFYTVITSSILFVFTRVFAPMFDQDIRARTREERRHALDPVALAETPAIAPSRSDGPAMRISEAAMGGRLSATPERIATV